VEIGKNSRIEIILDEMKGTKKYFRASFFLNKKTGKKNSTIETRNPAGITINDQVSIVDFSPYLRPLKIVLNT
jgi:hypothetical protein